MRAMARMMTDLPVRVRGPGRVYREETDKRICLRGGRGEARRRFIWPRRSAKYVGIRAPRIE